MKLLVMTFGCCAVALVTSVALFKLLTPSHLNTQAFEANAIQTTTNLPPVLEAQSSLEAPVTLVLTEKSPPKVFALPVTYIIGETHIYTDGLTVTLNAINDSHCLLDGVCNITIARAPEFIITNGVTSHTEKIMLGFALTASVNTAPYEYTLVNFTETEATVIIEPLNIKTTKTTATQAKTTLKASPLVTVDTIVHAPHTPISKPVLPKRTENLHTDFTNALVTEIEKRTNKFRRIHTLASLTTDTNLAKNATDYSTDLLVNRYLSHTDLQGCDITCRFADSGYKAQAWGENLAMLSFEERPSVEYVANFFMAQWEKSASHRQNLLSKAFSSQGIGVALNQNKIYMVVHFADPI